MYRARIRNRALTAATGQFDWFFSPDGSSWTPTRSAPTMENCGELWTADDSLPTWDRAQLTGQLAVFESLSAVAD